MNSYTNHIRFTCLETAAAVPWSGSALRCTVSLCRLCCCVPWVLVGGLSPIGGPADGVLTYDLSRPSLNLYLQFTSQSVLLQQAIAVVAMASVVLCFSSKVLQVDFKSATLLFHGLPLLALQEKSQIFGRVWTKIPKKGRQLLFLSDISMQIARVQCAGYPCNKQNSLQNACFSLRNAGRNHQQINKQNWKSTNSSNNERFHIGHQM